MLLDANGKGFATTPKQFVLRYAAIAFFQAVPPAIDFAAVPDGDALKADHEKWLQENEYPLVEREASGRLFLPAPEHDPQIHDEAALDYAAQKLIADLTTQIPDEAVGFMGFGVLMERKDEKQPATDWRPIGPFCFLRGMNEEKTTLLRRVLAPGANQLTAAGMAWQP